MLGGQSKPLRFLQGILTGKEREWLQTSDHAGAFQFRRLNFMLQSFPGDKLIEKHITWLLLGVISHRMAYK
jgi:hypothetical protein